MEQQDIESLFEQLNNAKSGDAGYATITEIYPNKDDWSITLKLLMEDTTWDTLINHEQLKNASIVNGELVVGGSNYKFYHLQPLVLK